MAGLTTEMIAAGAAVLEEYAGGDYLRWRHAVVRAWVEMCRAKDGEPHGGGETFTLAYDRNLAMAAELAENTAAAEQTWASRVAAAQEHGLIVPPADLDRSEHEWQEWLKVNG